MLTSHSLAAFPLARSLAQVGQWTSLIVESAVGKLTSLQKPFKYVGAKPPPPPYRPAVFPSPVRRRTRLALLQRPPADAPLPPQ